jgi:hypothetical protein
MNTKDLIRLGVPVGKPIQLAHEFIQNFIAQGKDGGNPSLPCRRRLERRLRQSPRMVD